MEIKSINRYIQKRNLLKILDEYINEENVVILSEPFIYDKYKHYINSKYKVCFDLKDIQCDCIIGFGGGKILDQVKEYAYTHNIKSILIPTSCANDGACTNIFVKEDKINEGNFSDIVLVDEEIISLAPSRLFISGLAEGLSTYYETRNSNMPLSIKVLSNTCKETILNHGIQALNDQKSGLISNGFSKCVEAILYMSGTVVSNTKEGLTHALAYAFQKYLPNYLHGELVAYFLLVQLCIENEEVIHEIKTFYENVGLPTHLNQIGLEDAEDEDLEFIIKQCDNKLLSNMNYIVNVEDIIEAIRVVDAFE